MAMPEDERPQRTAESALLARYRAAARRRSRSGPDSFPAPRRGTMRRLAGTPSGPGPDLRDPQPLGSLWGRFTRQQGWTQEIAVWSLATRWPQIAGPQIADHVAVVRFDAQAPAPADDAAAPVQGSLLPGPEAAPGAPGGRQADSPAWQQQLVWGLAHLQRRLDAELGPGVVGSIVVLGPQQQHRRPGPRRARSS
jgi:hypothetical protein